MIQASCRWALLLILPSCAISCSNSEPLIDPPIVTEVSDEESAPTLDPDAMPAPGEDPIVRLLEPGAEPRKLLRIRLNEGDEQQMVMRMKMAMEIEAGGREQEFSMPTIAMTMDFTAKAVAPNGDISYEFVLSEVAIEDDGGTPAMKEAMEAALTSARNLRVEGVYTSRSFNRGAKVSLPPDVNPQLAQTFDQMRDALAQICAPLPEEPVGIGAKWEVRMAVEQQGMVTKNIATYELIGMEGETLTVRSTVTLSADPQTIRNPQAPDLEMKLLSMSGTGGGETNWNLAALAPAKAKGNVNSETEMAFVEDGEDEIMKLQMVFDFTIEAD